MGLADSPYLFNRAARTYLYAIVHKYPHLYTDEIGQLIDSIIDDFYSGGIGMVLSLLREFIIWYEFRRGGWEWSNPKLEPPSPRRTIQGYETDAEHNTIQVPQDKVKKSLDRLEAIESSEFRVSLLACEKFAGIQNHIANVAPHLRAFMTSLYKFMARCSGSLHLKSKWRFTRPDHHPELLQELRTDFKLMR